MDGLYEKLPRPVVHEQNTDVEQKFVLFFIETKRSFARINPNVTVFFICRHKTKT